MSVVSKVIIFIVGMFIAGVLLPSAMLGFQIANYSKLSASASPIFYLLIPIAGGVSIALAFLKAGLGGKGD